MNSSKKQVWWKKPFTFKFAASYESELKITLILILLFLILTSASSVRITDKLADIYHKENYLQLKDGAHNLIDYVKKNVKVTRETENFRKLVSSGIIVRAAFIESNLLTQTNIPDDYGSPEDINYVKKYYLTLPLEKQKLLKRGMIVENGFGTGRDAGQILSFYPFSDESGIEWIGLFSKNAAGLKLVNTVMKFHYLFQIVGILAILLVAYAYLKITLNPFRKLANEAKRMQADESSRGESVEQVVETFRATINRLQENEDKLKQLYNNSQERAARLEQFNQYILESMSSGLIGIDQEGHIVHLNRSSRKILQLNEDEININSFKTTFSEYESLVRLLENTLQDQKPVERLEQHFTQRSGNEKILGISSSPVYDHKNRIVGAILLLADLTEVRRLQNEISFKEKMAAVGEMSAGLAHEMRNAMMAIVGYSKILKKGSPESINVRDIAASISVESEHCETMLKRFLMFAKPVAFTPEDLQLDDVVKSVVKKLDHIAQKKHVDIVTKIDKNQSGFFSDRTALDQIFTNLIKNAIEAVPDNGQVNVQAKIKHDQNIITIEISDNGPGIPEEYYPKLFSPFFTTKETGTGLGLAIVKKLVNAMGGDIEPVIRPDEGVCFRIILPQNSTVDSPNFKLFESTTC
jgi:two-component system, NtrC family, nitrogen regulation sensor histidine kinase GlnL